MVLRKQQNLNCRSRESILNKLDAYRCIPHTHTGNNRLTKYIHNQSDYLTSLLPRSSVFLANLSMSPLSNPEVKKRIDSAPKTLGALQKLIWSGQDIKIASKSNRYITVVLPSLFHLTQTVAWYRRHVRKPTRIKLWYKRNLIPHHTANS